MELIKLHIYIYIVMTFYIALQCISIFHSNIYLFVPYINNEQHDINNNH